MSPISEDGPAYFGKIKVKPTMNLIIPLYNSGNTNTIAEIPATKTFYGRLQESIYTDCCIG